MASQTFFYKLHIKVMSYYIILFIIVYLKDSFKVTYIFHLKYIFHSDHKITNKCNSIEPCRHCLVMMWLLPVAQQGGVESESS